MATLRGESRRAAQAPGDPASDGSAGRTFILLNPAAGHDDPARLRRLIGRAFSARGVDFDLVLTDHPGHATELAARAARQGYRICCAVGGDGTLAEVATGLAGSDVPVALIPRGTGNQVAQNLGIPLSIKRAVEVAIQGRRAPLDLGRVGERSFALAAGAGYDAAVMAAATRQLKERFGFGAYVIATLREAMALEPAEFRILADGSELRVSAVSVILANMAEIILPLLPIRLPLGPHRGPTWCDGRLDIVVLAPRNLAGWAAVLWRAARRRFGGDERLIHLQAEEVTIEATPAVPVQVDGDPAGQTPIVARAIHHGVDILVP